MDYFVIRKQGCFQKFWVSIIESQPEEAPSGQIVTLVHEKKMIIIVSSASEHEIYNQQRN